MQAGARVVQRGCLYTSSMVGPLRGVNCRLRVPSYVIAHPGIDSSSRSGFFVFCFLDPIIGDSVSAVMENNVQRVHSFFFYTVNVFHKPLAQN